MSNKPLNYSLVMQGSAVDQQSFAAIYNFISIINTTDNMIEIYQRKLTVSQPTDMVGRVLPFTSLTVPIDRRQDFSFIYTDGGAAGTKVASVILSEDNLGYSGALGTTVSGNVGLISDSVGLARQAQLPVALGGSGGLKVEVVAQPGVTSTIATAAKGATPAGSPTSESVNADKTALHVSIERSLPAGGNALGTMGVTSLPGSPAQEGTDITGSNMPAGGAGIRGWLSAMYGKLAGTLTATLTGALPAGGNALGTVGVTAGTAMIGSVKAQQGSSSSLNITAATAVKAAAGRVIRVSVVVAGTTAGSVHDAATTGAAAAANLIASLPNTVGVLYLDWPCAVGIVVTPGTGQTLAVSYE